ncbi:MAG: phenylacetate-CoA oxygenase subunit PaaJ [Saprospiraceae bacterium]|nr:phenylacetate-CoA oxygenase subunit PaaJ [Saprospiraceae bacterium]
MVSQIKYTKPQVLRMLVDVRDPEIPVLSIEEIGMLRDVVIHENSCEVIITPTYTACPAMAMIEKDIKLTLTAQGISQVKVTTVYAPAWSTDWMSSDTKEKLRAFGIAAPLHSGCAAAEDRPTIVECPRCFSTKTTLISQFGSTACKALYRCEKCLEPFDYFKCH